MEYYRYSLIITKIRDYFRDRGYKWVKWYLAPSGKTKNARAGKSRKKAGRKPAWVVDVVSA